jgi:hypothetical protein
MVCGADFGGADWQCKVDIGGDHGETEEYSKCWETRCERAEAALEVARAEVEKLKAERVEIVAKTYAEAAVWCHSQAPDVAVDTPDEYRRGQRRAARDCAKLMYKLAADARTQESP